MDFCDRITTDEEISLVDLESFLENPLF